MNKHKILNGGQKRTLLGGPKERKARKACQKAMMAFRMVVFALTSQTKAQARTIPRTKARERTKKGKGEERAYPQSGLSASDTPYEDGYGHVWESDDWSASHSTDVSWTSAAGWFLHESSHCMDGGNPFEPCQPSNTCCSGPWLHTVDWIKDSRSMHGIMALRRNFAVVISLSCSPTPRQKPAWKVALSTCQQHHHVLPRLMCLRQVTCPSCFPFIR